MEVKSASYIQSWSEDGSRSQIFFDITPKLPWSPECGYGSAKARNCDLYVFAVYTALSRSQNVLDLGLWDFYVLATHVLNREVPEQKKISLSSLLRFSPEKTSYDGLLSAVESIEL